MSAIRRIFKYPLEVEQRQLLHMPVGAQLVAVIEQQEMPVLYALVDEEAPHEQRIIRVVTTGEEFTAESRYIGTAVLKGWYVAHVLELLPDARFDPLSDRFEEDRREAAAPAA